MVQTRLSAKLENCAICHEKSPTQGRLSGCGHSFCWDCILEWAKVSL